MPTLPDTTHDHFFLKHLQSVKANGEWYYNQRFLGRGGNGTAFLVTCSSGLNIGMQFVLKVFHNEGTFLASSGMKYPFAVIEFVPVTARSLLVSKQVDRLRAIRIALNCLSAIDCMHRAATPLIHRDIKPENILISEMGAKLADFGLVKALDDLQAEDGVDAFDETQWPGMPWRYRTPELVQRAHNHTTKITPKSDIYQFGTVLYELLTGFNPQLQPMTVTDSIILDLREIKGGQGHQLGLLIKSMLAEKPSNRPPAKFCLGRLNEIHEAYCKSLFNVTGQFV
jgi:serine/threonine protein kinase